MNKENISGPAKEKEIDITILHSDEAERAVLGAILLEKTAYSRVESLLTPEMFYNEKNKAAFGLFESLSSSGKIIDLVSAFEASKGSKSIQATDLVYLSDTVVSTSSLEQHAAIVRELYAKRKFMEAMSRAKDSVFSGEDIGDTLQTINIEIENVQGILVGGKSGNMLSDVLEASLTSMYQRQELAKDGKLTGITTGLRLDDITNGWQPSELVVLAARPAMGKTAMMLHFAKSAASIGKYACIFSLEMSDISLVNRLLISESGVDADKFKQGRLSKNEANEVEKAAGRLHKLPIFIDDKALTTIGKIQTKCRLLHKLGKCDIVFIDYLQLAQGSGRENRNREQDIAEISRKAKVMAKELKIPVILLSQLNRSVELRTNKQPQLSDLRESGAIEQDADMVIFIHRPEYYSDTAEKGKGELIVSKYRNGATGTLYFHYNKSLTCIGDYKELKTEKTPF